MKTNVAPAVPTPRNHEGTVACRINAYQTLRRSVLACLLWEDTFYEEGVAVAERIAEGVKACKAEQVAALAIEARTKFNLRHVPLFLVRELARNPSQRHVVAATLAEVIQRPDELGEFLSLYFGAAKRNQPLAAQVKKGLARAFAKFNEYQLGKWNQDGAFKLRDVLFLTHAKAKDEEQAALWKRLVDKTLATPDTWEVELSASKDKKASWERLLSEKKLGALALLRNLRNMIQVGIGKDMVRVALDSTKMDRVLPFRFIAAARAVPGWEDVIEPAMLRSMEGASKLRGKTLLLIDTSPSMAVPLSSKSDLSRMDAAFGLAVLVRELCDDVEIWAFSQDARQAPSRRGFALADAIRSAVPSNGTLLGKAVAAVSGRYDRLICITDEESQDAVRDPDAGKQAYMMNVATYKNGVGYGKWTHIDGFSEAVLDFVRESETQG